MENAILFFFTYTFGGKVYIQVGGGPIGARITMAVARLVMQEWKDSYNQILKNSNIVELLSSLYVEFQRLLEMGERYIEEEKAFKIVNKERKKIWRMKEPARISLGLRY